MHYSQSYFMLPLFWGQIGLNYPPPPVADWGCHQRGKYPRDILGNQLNLCLIWHLYILAKFQKDTGALFVELFHVTLFSGAKSD